MRNATFVLATVLLACAGIGAAWWAMHAGEVVAPPAPAAGSETGAPVAVPQAFAHPAPAVADAPAAAPRTTEAPSQPTGVVRIVDPDAQPLPGATVHRLPDGERIATAGADGCCTLPAGVPVAVFGDGRLLRVATPFAQATAERPLVVALRRDDLSPRAVVECVDGSGAEVAGARALCRLRGSGAAPAALALASTEALAAWGEHATLAEVAELAARARLVTSGSGGRPLRLDARTELRFLAGGAWSLVAVADDGRMAAVDFAVESTAPVPVRAVFLPTRPIAGVVVAADTGAPLGGALVDIVDAGPLVAAVATDAQGRFSLPALPAIPVLLRARAEGRADAVNGPFVPGAADVRIGLNAAAAAALRGRVVAVAGDAPIAGATVDGSEDGVAPRRAVTAADGTFELATAGGDVMLRVAAPTFAAFAGSVPAGGGQPVAIALWPATSAARIAAALTGTLEGRVIDADGRAVADALVRWQAADPVAARRADRLEIAPPLLQLVRTDRDGAFAIEIAGTSRGTLFLVAPVLRMEQGIQTTSVAGIRRKELLLRTGP